MAVETPYKTVIVDGLYFEVPKDTPSDGKKLLDPELERELYQQAQRQKATWAQQESQLQAARASWDRPARRDQDGGMITEGRLEGDDPIVQEDVDAADEPIEDLNPRTAVAPDWRRQGETEDVTDRQSGWRP